VAGLKREAVRQGGKRLCGLGRRDKQTDAIWQEEPCSHLQTEADRRYKQAGKQVESSHADKGTEARGCRGRQAEEQGGNKVKRYACRNAEKQAG
jgi:hypothetical protein